MLNTNIIQPEIIVFVLINIREKILHYIYVQI